MNPLAEYRSRLEARGALRDREQQLFRLIGNLRLFVGIAGVVVAFFVFGITAISAWWLVIPLASFSILVVIHSKIVERLEAATRAVTFFEQGIARLENRWAGRGEPGERFRNPAHVYADDLDVFGKGSLYELLCTARTRAGENSLAGWLLHPARIDEARARQDALVELRARLDLREDFAVLGESVRSGMDPDVVVHWAAAPEIGFPRWTRALAALLGAAVVLTLGLYLAGWWSRTPFLAALMLELAFGFSFGRKTLAVAGAVNSPARDLALLSELLERIEGETFASPLLARWKARLDASGLRASREIARLRGLVSRLDWQRNVLFTPVAMAILWSLQIAISIERWRRVSGAHIGEWIETIGEFEALLALAGYSYEHPDDPLPELSDAPGGLFDAEAIGHPLMAPADCVRNDVRLGGDLRLLIVSGSNMSGKSTLLRSVGLNAVLAWSGAPVRAKALRISPLAVGASLRILDSLQDGRSRFYAEITRLREVVNLAGGERTLLFLIDELLSGTNSHDRRIGAGAIVRTLVDRGAIGLITTHDLALAQIASDFGGRAANVHFEDALEDGRLHFDYRLRQGIVERSNALDLMRSVGLEV